MAANPSTSHIGANIRRARETAGLTQLALAHLMGWKSDDAGAQISRIESGKNVPKLATVIHLAKLLKTTVDKLLQ